MYDYTDDICPDTILQCIKIAVIDIIYIVLLQNSEVYPKYVTRHKNCHHQEGSKNNMNSMEERDLNTYSNIHTQNTEIQ